MKIPLRSPGQHLNVSSSNEAARFAREKDSRLSGAVAGKLLESFLQLRAGLLAQGVHLGALLVKSEEEPSLDWGEY